MKKTLLAGALVIGLVAVGCSSNDATPAPPTEPPAAATDAAPEPTEAAAEPTEAAVEPTEAAAESPAA